MNEHDSISDDALLNLEEKSNEELRMIIDELGAEEQRISYRRRVLHGKLDILRAEMVRRMHDKCEAGGDIISGCDVDRLIGILSNELRSVPRVDVTASLEGNES
ncbi:MAG: hypothetical protein FWE94_07435 [Coriobacteriia bacterium]|nr:hypothetical protein [Coriobacteriia bacterium]